MTREANTKAVRARFLGRLNYAGLALVALVFLFPFFWMVSNALRTNDEVLAVPPRLLPSVVHWENFIEAWVHLPFGQFFFNSLVVAISVTILVVVISCLAGYAFARLTFWGRDTLFLSILAL